MDDEPPSRGDTPLAKAQTPTKRRRQAKKSRNKDAPKLSNLVLQVYADKKHNRRQLTHIIGDRQPAPYGGPSAVELAAAQGAGLSASAMVSGGSKSPKGPNQDIPFALSGNERSRDHVSKHHSQTNTASSKNYLPPAARGSPNQLTGTSPAHGSASSLRSS